MMRQLDPFWSAVFDEKTFRLKIHGGKLVAIELNWNATQMLADLLAEVIDQGRKAGRGESSTIS